MSDETTLVEGAGEALPADSTTSTTTDANEAQAATTEAVATEQAEAAKKESDEQQRKRNRTKEYIDRINRENAELRQKAAELEARQQTRAPEKAEGPTLEQFNYDLEAFQRALIEHQLEQREHQQKQAETSRRQAEIAATYNHKVAEFIDSHPDFQEVVGSIAYPLTPQVEAAIMAHPQGPEIAYHLGTNDDDAFVIASTQPHLAEAAIKRLASRMTAAPQTPQPTPSKPISQAPPPPPTVGGRAPVDVPPEKLTDDEWYARTRAKRGAK